MQVDMASMKSIGVGLARLSAHYDGQYLLIAHSSRYKIALFIVVVVAVVVIG